MSREKTESIVIFATVCTLTLWDTPVLASISSRLSSETLEVARQIDYLGGRLNFSVTKISHNFYHIVSELCMTNCVPSKEVIRYLYP